MASGTAHAFCLIRSGGLGDVIMALAAAKALKQAHAAPVFLGTHPQYWPLARACPHVDEVFSNNSEFQAIVARYPGVTVSAAQLDRAAFGMAGVHQVDAYLQAFALQAPALHKAFETRVDATAAERAARWLQAQPAPAAGAARILLHAGSGDPNRTWPRARWEALATQLLADGHQVIAIGHRSAVANRSVQPLAVAGLRDAVDAWDALGTIELMRQCDLLVSTDGGPIQLAGATDIGIVGLYSVVAGAHRLPFRRGQAGWRARAVEPTCSAFPCYARLHDPAVAAQHEQALRSGRTDAARLFAEFCVVPERYHCMTHEIDPRRVHAAALALLNSADA
jgi:ADP-heptose:LPS heptosyltransferase